MKSVQKLLVIMVLWALTTACLSTIWGTRDVSRDSSSSDLPAPMEETVPADPEPEEDTSSPTSTSYITIATFTSLPATGTTTPFPMCTPPACAPDEMYFCPGECPGGCGTTCATATPGSSSGYGEVWGKICFPGESIPQMTVYFQNVNTLEIMSIPIEENQITYEMDLPGGVYIAFAWSQDRKLGGSYSQYVLCQGNTDCNDHNLIEFLVRENHVHTDVDICDWYGDTSIFPEVP